MLIDLQVHSRDGSPDSRLTSREAAEACLEVGLDGVALTEHLRCDHSEAREIFEGEGLVLVSGREVSCGGSHLLVLSEDEELLAGLPSRVTPEDPRLLIAVCIWAHPAALGGSSAYVPVLPDPPPGDVLDAVEVLNGRHMHMEASVTLAEQAAAGLGAMSSGASDAHDRDEVGRCATEVQVEPPGSPGEVIEALRGGRIRPVLLSRWARRRGYSYRQTLRRFLV